MRAPAFVTSLVLLAAPILGAQQASRPDRRTVFTINPIATVAGFVTGDIERKLSPSVSLGAGGSATLIDEFNRYSALEAKIRYYPNERALEGIAVAATVGVATARGDGYDNNTNLFVINQRVTRATFGTELSYQWLLGPRQRFATVIGIGAKRSLGSRTYVEPFDNAFVPTARANIGFAF